MYMFMRILDPQISNLAVTPMEFTGLESTCPDSYSYHNFTLICMANFPAILRDTFTDFTLTWYHNNTTRTSNLTILNTGLTLVRTIHIANASIADTGEYTCTANIGLLESTNVSESVSSQVLIRGE